MQNSFERMDCISLELVKERMLNKYVNNWKMQVQNKPKLYLYKTFKVEYKTEDYLKMELNCVERAYLAQLRLGILPIEIETGRYRSVAREERICQICNMNNVEDELHFLLYCTAYENIRMNWLDKMDINIDILDGNIEHSRSLLKKIFDFPRQTAKYIVRAMEIRRNILYK